MDDPPENFIKQITHDIIGTLVGEGSCPGLSGINITEQFQPENKTHLAITRNINAAFLIVLADETHPKYKDAVNYLDEKETDTLFEPLVSFYKDGVEYFFKEFKDYCAGCRNIGDRLNKLKGELKKKSFSADAQEQLWELFHPEAAGILKEKKKEEDYLRERRTIRITSLNPEPVRSVPSEVLFTANALLTVPPPEKKFNEITLSPALEETLKEVMREEQAFWYDHPIPVGVEPEKNEILYGLRHLSEALQYEKEAGVVAGDSEITCILSASVTHVGLHQIVKGYVEHELEKSRKISGLNLYLFTESDSVRLVKEVLLPAAKKYFKPAKNLSTLFNKVIGVDGKYGRHYSFLKAIAAFWQVFIDPEKKATFKIDLDQIFPQENLLKETGKTAFQHLMTPLWGAMGADPEGAPVELGMIAGSLVNEKDIASSLFTPDVTYPAAPFRGEDTVFCSRIPQALSTAAEMMTRYNDKSLDGKHSCLHRVHVTGGTNGILVDALRKYRPFTPTFIGRAEDQAYLLPVLYPQGTGPALRYVHKDGFIMRHDKKAFAGEAIQAAAIGKIVGDYERILLFSNYAKILPWGADKIKKIFNPFTGSFISPIPLSLSYLRLALKAADLFSTHKEEDGRKGLELVEIGSGRLRAAIHDIYAAGAEGLKTKYEKEKHAWDLFYELLDRIESDINEGTSFAIDLKHKALKIVQETRVSIIGDY